MKTIKLFALGLISMFVLASCDKDENDPMDPMPKQKNIVETAMANDNLSILVAAIQQAGLVDALSADGPFTVFAPTNDAFMALLNANPAWTSLEDIDEATLRAVLLYHVTSGEVMAADLSDTYVSTLSPAINDEPLSLQVSTTGGVMFNGSSKPVTTDIMASNGLIHVIDKVMLPQNVVGLALNNPVFSSLVAALTRSDLTTDYVGILSGAGPFTVFAPTNDAFAELLASNP
ncbi:MAG TPA: fasciclin domain-containing protein, partial [Bacteroidales bacterium]|nr:fasciclin domain-containing protein [Bacteroidales bacterium]